ncbi:oligopeptide/dipeptide ABC transporter ATP-binding protein [Chromobacterium sp. CV08]|uniref:oligopeptide/dipeptide ABC transporter ATP-binding protein n=1 Tax=Chromobacterium sp. CV08 TaxID=3133274 RepID=UPI003DAA441C
MSHDIITIERISKRFRSGGSWLRPGHTQALDQVSLPLRQGRTLAVVGESGSGKSTLARLLLQLERPSAGAIRIAGRNDSADIADIPLRDYYRRVQMVFQDPYSSLNPRKPIWQIVTTALARRGGPSREARMRIAEQQLRAVGLGEQFLHVLPGALSGGQRQRVGIARALASQPEILVLDEPLSALDISVQAQILNLLLELQQRLRLTFVFISHDLSVVRHIADDVAVMYAGQLLEYGEAGAVIDSPRHPYTQALVASMPGRQDAKRAPPPPGELQTAAIGPSACAFAPRCAHAQARCSTQRPAMLALADRNAACFLIESLQ